MGLDMYLSGHKHRNYDWDNPDNNPHDDGFRVAETILRLGYWRKHPNLHGYIVNTFANGTDDCRPIDLSPDDIRTLIDAVETRDLPETSGFFFGESDGTETPDDMATLRAALAWVETPDKDAYRCIVYQASW